MQSCEPHVIPIQRLTLCSAAIFAALFGAVFAVLTLLARLGLEGAGFLSALKLLLMLAANLSMLAGAASRGAESPRWHALGAMMFVGTNGLVLLLAQQPAGGFAIYPLLGVMFWFGLSQFRPGAEQSERIVFVLSVPLGIAFGALYFFAANAMGYAHSLAPESVMIGRVHQDTMFHAATASMLARFGVVTTGLDGLTFVANHPLSHLVIGRLALWLDVSPVMAYALVPRLLLLPLLMFTLLAATLALWRPRSSLGVMFPAVLAPLTVMMGFEIFDSASHLVSESYVLALLLLFLALPIMAALPASASKYEAALALLVLLILLSLVALAKMTVGFALAGGLFAMLLIVLVMHRLWRILALLAGLASLSLLVAGTALIISPTIQNALSSAIGFWEFPTRYPAWAYPNMLMALTGGLTPIIVAALTDRARLVEACGLSGIALTGLVAGILASAPAGAQYYLVNVGCWIAYVAIAAYVILPMLERLRLEWIGSGVMALGVIIAVAVTPGKSGAPSAWAALQKTLALHAVTAQQAFATAEARPPLPADATFRQQVEASFGATLLATLKRDIKEPRETLVHIPPALEAFWRINPNCRVPGWIVPGMLGVPMVQGVHASCDLLLYYGFEAYAPVARNRDAGDGDLCARAKALGFHIVLRVESARLTRRLDCTGA